MNTRNQKLILLALPAALIIILIISLILIFTQTPASAKHITIENFHDIAKDVPDFYKNEIQSRLWQTLVATGNADDNTYTTAVIRDGSYQTNQVSDDLTSSEFLVDIPNLSQSFSVNFNWSRANNPEDYDVAISCPYFTQVIYDTYCQTSAQAFDELYRYLPSAVPNSNVVLFANFYDTFTPGRSTSDPYLSVSIGDCELAAQLPNTNKTANNQTNQIDQPSDLLSPYKSLVKDWLRARYVDPEKIDIEYSPYCAVKTAD